MPGQVWNGQDYCESARSVNIAFKKVCFFKNHREIRYDSMMFAFATRFGRIFWCVKMNNDIIEVKIVGMIYLHLSLMTNCV